MFDLNTLSPGDETMGGPSDGNSYKGPGVGARPSKPEHRSSPPPKVPPPPIVGPLRSVVKETAYNPEKQRDRVRAITNFSFVFVFALTIIAALYVVLWDGSSWSQTKELLDLLLPAETALIGSAVGFYFGSKAAQSDHS